MDGCEFFLQQYDTGCSIVDDRCIFPGRNTASPAGQAGTLPPLGLRLLRGVMSCGAAKAKFNTKRICLVFSGELKSFMETLLMTARAAISPARFKTFWSQPV